MIRLACAALAVGFLTAQAAAADLGMKKPSPAAPVAATSCKESEKTALPSDVFGFSAGSDVSDVGAYGLGLEYNGAFNGGGFKTGGFAGHLGKVQLSTAFVPCWEVGPYLLGTASRGTFDGVTGAVKYTSFGGGIENKYKILGRDTHGIGLTLVVDPNYQGFRQTDSTVAPQLGWSGGQMNATYKILIDRELIAGKLWGALNVQVDQVWTERPSVVNPLGTSDYFRNSNLTLSGALSYQLLDGFYVGAETRYVRTHNGAFLNTFTGDALYVGPTAYWQATKAVSLSGTWGIQVAGEAKFAAGTAVAPNLMASNLNLVTQNQHVAKVKLGIGF